MVLTVTYQNGKHRTESQNKLQRLWLNQIAEQLGDRTAEMVRGECKLTMGVPILRAENDDFCEKYDRIIRSHSYEEKVEMMMLPLDFPVTRLMNVSQSIRYLDHLHRHFVELGLELTQPDPQFRHDAERHNRATIRRDCIDRVVSAARPLVLACLIAVGLLVGLGG